MPRWLTRYKLVGAYMDAEMQAMQAALVVDGLVYAQLQCGLCATGALVDAATAFNRAVSARRHALAAPTTYFGVTDARE